jgi:hypothetical protein
MDPQQYFTPDVVADFTQVRLQEVGPNQVQVTGGRGKKKPSTLKVSVGYQAGFIGEGEISYAGPNALGRAQLSGNIIKQRLSAYFPELWIDYIGSTSVHRTNFGNYPEPYEIRLRIAGKATTTEIATRVGEEVEALYTNGAAGGGGARKYVQEVIGIISNLIPRKKVKPKVTLLST